MFQDPKKVITVVEDLSDLIFWLTAFKAFECFDYLLGVHWSQGWLLLNEIVNMILYLLHFVLAVYELSQHNTCAHFVSDSLNVKFLSSFNLHCKHIFNSTFLFFCERTDFAWPCGT